MNAKRLFVAREGRSETVAAALSFLWPGLGQWYQRRPNVALAFAVPAFVVVAFLALRALSGLESLALSMFVPEVALAALALVVLGGAWRIAAILETRRESPRTWRVRDRSGAVVGLLLAMVVLMHGVLAYYAWSFYQSGSRIFVTDQRPPVVLPTVQPATRAPGGPPPTPVPSVDPGPPRITILLTGVDSGPNRNHSLTDTLLVASLDPVSRDVVMLSFPRDIASFELWDGRTYRGKINSLQTYAENHPAEFPAGGLPSLMAQLSYLSGIPIDYYAAIDLQGFRRMIDAVGGVTVNVDRTIHDVRYDWLDGNRGFHLDAGVHTLDGRTALAYVRSRQGIGDNDFTRARRQQELLLALRKKLTDVAMVAKLPELLAIAADTIKTNYPSGQVTDILDLLAEVDDQAIRRFVLGPPYAIHPPSASTGGIYELRLDMDRIATLSIDLFGDDSRYADLAGDP